MKRSALLLPLSAFLAVFALRAGLALYVRFDGLYGQDPFAYYGYAVQLHHALRAFQPPPPFFWPLGYPLPVALAMFALGTGPLAGQLVSIAGGALAAAFVALLVADLSRPGVGAAIAGLLAGAAAQATISSLSIMSDALAMAWAACSAWAMLRYCRGLRLRWLALAAVALGAAVLTRWMYGLAVLPWGLAALLAWRRAAIPWRQIAGAVLLAVGAGGLVLGSQFAGALAGAGELSHVGDLQVVGWDPRNAFRATVENSDGVFHYQRPTGVYYALPLAHPAFVFPLFTPFLLLGVWRLRRVPWPPLALLAGWPLTAYVLLAGIAWQNPRFSLALFPPLAALVGIGLQAAWDGAPSARWRGAAAALCALGLAGSLAWTVRDVGNFVARKDEALAAARWAEARLPAGAAVITFGLTDTLRHYTGLEVIELYNETPESLRARLCGSGDAHLFVEPATIEAQWAGRSPEINLRWLRESAGLAEEGQNGAWVLFRVGERACD